ncbi:MAG: family 43 glycosylhydrolase [Spirochaetales bacterium]|nr:family 43 glycosylhydrolase [Spirochaetales bacterium]
MKKKAMTVCISLMLLFIVISAGYAGNPLVTNVRTADPNPFVYNDRFYIVCGQDEVNTDGFNMYAWRLLSSTNMRDWTDHGQILRPDQINWMPDNRAWASSIVYRNGYFYFYASNDRQIGVLRSTSVTGPYEDINGGPIIDGNTPGHAARDIDPMCFIDDDGQAYLFWGGDGNCRYARLESNMTSLAGSVMDVPGLTSYLEAPFVIKENGTYFLMYADSPWPSEIRYATSSGITGPWQYRGVIGTPTGSGTNHEGAAYYKGQWWYAYHTEELSNDNPYSRSVCVDKMYVNGTTIERIVYTDNNGGGIDEPTAVPTAAPTPPPASQNPVWSGGPYTLDGTDDYIDVPDNITMELYDFTIAAWVNLVSAGTWSRIFDFGSDTTCNMFLTPSCDSGTIRFAITVAGNSDEQRIDGSSFPTGSWQHVAVTKSGNTGILYVNGSEAGRNTSMTLSPVDLGGTLCNYIGRSQYAGDPYLNGSVDDFLIYNRQLGGSEILTLSNYPPGSTGAIGDVNDDGAINIVDALLVAQYYVGLDPQGFNRSRADANCNGNIDIVDALLVAQYYVGLIDRFCQA